MGNPVIDPGDGGGAATADVAALIASISLPPIEPFTPDNPMLAELPAYIPYPVPSPEPPSRAALAREVYDATVAGIEAVKRLEDATAACKAALVARLMDAAAIEARALGLDNWQSGVAETSASSEVAMTLCIPEGTAATLIHHATELISNHADTRAALTDGLLSWRHAAIIIDETQTLAETPGTTTKNLQAFESRLLKLATGSTASSFKSKARRAREGAHPQTLATRTRQAVLKREMTLEPGADGMCWLTLHLPAPAAEGIWVHCTRQARKQQRQPDEHRTLTQLRIDTATTLLLGQHLPDHPDQGSASTAHGEYCAHTGDGSGYMNGLVDGLSEDPVGEYLTMLEADRTAGQSAGPALPEAQIIVTVPVLGLLGKTNEPAQLAGYGPIAETTARKLLANSSTLLRLLTDPISNKPLDLNPDRYRVRDAERAVLNAMSETCSWPNCCNPAMLSELDHVNAWEHGGKSASDNERPLCRRHHALKHFKDDKDKHGRYRQVRNPDRAGIRLRGWKPALTPDGRMGWTSPSGKYHPPLRSEDRPPHYPRQLKRLIEVAPAKDITAPTTKPPTGRE